jgi:L-asparaginase
VQPIVVEVLRAGIVEAKHRVHAVAVREGRIVEAAGEPELVTYFRSSAKPVQVLPLVRARPDVDDAEIAIASASHMARPEQLALVRSLLEKASAREDDLECGAEPTRIAHNCSGKHAGMLLLCRENGWASTGYRLLEHPCQRAMLHEVAAAAEISADVMPTAMDGCGVVTFGFALERMAHAFARFRELDGGERVARAMRSHPALIRGPGAPDTLLMERLPGWIAKGGAEGLLCASSDDGLGIAVKTEDGSWRPLRTAAAAFLGRLGVEADDFGQVPVTNSRGEVVGRLRVA